MTVGLAFDVALAAIVGGTLFVLLAKSGISFRRIEAWWDSLSLPLQLLSGGIAAFVLWLVWATALIRVVAWAWTGEWMPLTTDNNGLQKLGQIGDLFGGINALFAAFAFVGVAIAAHYQHKTFKLQAEQHVRQSFEPLFFKLLDEHEPPANLVPEFLPANVPIPAKHFADCVADLRAHLIALAEAHRSRTTSSSFTWETFAECYETFYVQNESQLGPYFRQLFHIFKLIARSDLKWPDKVQYANIARASLDTNELMLLLLNCASKRGEDFRTYVVGFGLLKHIRVVPIKDRVTIDSTITNALYPSTATMDAASREEYWMKHPKERPLWAADGKGEPLLPSRESTRGG